MSSSPLYFPITVNLETTLYFLNEQFEGLAVSFDPVIDELLKETFNRSPGTYGIHGQGAVAALKVQLPDALTPTFIDAHLDRVLHLAKGYLMDEMTAIVLGDVTPQTSYRFLGGDTVLLYLPLPENCRDDALRASAVPLEATRYFD